MRFCLCMYHVIKYTRICHVIMCMCNTYIQYKYTSVIKYVYTLYLHTHITGANGLLKRLLPYAMEVVAETG